MSTSITPSNALNRVRMFARRICPTVLVGAAGTSLTSPRATRSATSSARRPRAGSTAVARPPIRAA
jgi:hypothetical protein